MKELFPSRLVYQDAGRDVPNACEIGNEAAEQECEQDHEAYLFLLDGRQQLVESLLAKNPDNASALEAQASIEIERDQYTRMLHSFYVVMQHLEQVTPENINTAEGEKWLTTAIGTANSTFEIFEQVTGPIPLQKKRYDQLKETILDRFRAVEQSIENDDLRRQAQELLGMNVESILGIQEITPERIDVATQSLEEAYVYVRDKLHKKLKDKVVANPTYEYKSGLAMVEAFLAEPFNVNDYLPMMIKESRLDPTENNDNDRPAKGICQIIGGDYAARAEINKYYSYAISDSEVYDPVKNSVVGVLYLHRCREHYAQVDKYNHLNEADKELMAYAIYNFGPSIGEVWDDINPPPQSYAEFEETISDAMMAQLNIQGFTPGENPHLTEIKDPYYNITYEQTDAVTEYLRIGRFDALLKPNLVINGVTTNIPLYKVGEVTRYVRMLEAIDNLMGEGTPISPPVAPPEEPPEEETVTATATGIYKVQPGDTLWAIAQAHGMTIDELRNLNGFASDYTGIQPKDKIKVRGEGSEEPPEETPEEPPEETPEETVEIPEDPNQMVHEIITIAPGKSLWTPSEDLRKKVREWGVEGFESTENPSDHVDRETERQVLIKIIIDFNNEYFGKNIRSQQAVPVGPIRIPNEIYIESWINGIEEASEVDEEIRKEKEKKKKETPAPLPEELVEVPGLGRREYVYPELEAAGARILTNKYNLDLNAVEKNPKRSISDVELDNDPNTKEKTPDRTETTHIILHSTNAENSSDRGYEGTLKSRKAHYVISREGRITMARDPEDRIDHSGTYHNRTTTKSYWRGNKALTFSAIGIEVATLPGEEWSSEQYTAVRNLVHALGGHYQIPANHVLTHGQVAMGKTDRGMYRIAKPCPANVEWDQLDLPNNYAIIDYDVIYGDMEANWRDLLRGDQNFKGMKKSDDRFEGLRESERLARDPEFRAYLDGLDAEALAAWKSSIEQRADRIEDYTVKRGDNLSKIAKKYKTSVAIIRKYNGLRSDNIGAGKKLKVPVNVR
jgi:LysM repeat protein/N-acetyl-anhydromuramyl-L-alanine amidase AmpD